MGWVAFAYDNADPPDDAAVDMSGPRAMLRPAAGHVLRTVARGRQVIDKPDEPLPLPGVLAFALKPRQTVVEVSLQGLKTYDKPECIRDSLIPALTQKIGPAEEAWQRLRICSCDRVFVALVPTTEWCRRCSNRERQRRFYKRNIHKQRKIKLAAYHARHNLHIERVKREVGVPDLRQTARKMAEAKVN